MSASSTPLFYSRQLIVFVGVPDREGSGQLLGVFIGFRLVGSVHGTRKGANVHRSVHRTSPTPSTVTRTRCVSSGQDVVFSPLPLSPFNHFTSLATVSSGSGRAEVRRWFLGKDRMHGRRDTMDTHPFFLFSRSLIIPTDRQTHCLCFISITRLCTELPLCFFNFLLNHVLDWMILRKRSL